MPSFNADSVATKALIQKIEASLKRESAQIWINYDAGETASIAKAPAPVE